MSQFFKKLTIDDPRRLVLLDLPFHVGDRVEISIEKEYQPRTDAGRRWKELFERMDRSSEIQRLSPEQVTEEISAHRTPR